MIPEFQKICSGILSLIEEWEPRLLQLSEQSTFEKRNSQNRSVKQIVGHMVDSASNNRHRFVHLQYQESPLRYPNYAINGNNDRWIAIQNYEGENWSDLVHLWKYSNMHVVHVIRNVDSGKLENKWYYDEDTQVSLKEMIIDYLSHLQLHLDEINALISEERIKNN